MSTFEQRLKNFIQEKYTDPPAEWIFFGTENNDDIWKDLEPLLKEHNTWTHVIPGRHDIYFILEECNIQIERKVDPSEAWKDSLEEDHRRGSQYSLWLCDRPPEIKDGREEYGLRMAHVSWNPFEISRDTNGISNIKIDLISPVFRPSFERYHYIMDVINRIADIPFHDT